MARASLDQRPLIFRKFLIKFEPFVVFAMLLLKGYDVQDSARRIRVIFSVPESQNIIVTALRSWGKYGGIIDKSDHVIGVTEDKLTEQYLTQLIQALQDEWHAKLFVAGKIREAAYAFLTETEKGYLIYALQKYRLHPDDSMKDVGNAFENFLRKVASANQLANTQQQRGIGQLANLLRSSKVILEEHKKMCDYVNVFRIAADHGSHPETSQPWKIESDTALEAFLSSLTTIRSIFSFTNGDGQVL